MKSIILLAFLLLICFSNSRAGEFTGAGKRALAVLEAQSISWASLERTGHGLVANGEFTGGGKSVSIPKLKYVVAPDEAYEIHDIDSIKFKPASGNMIRPAVDGLPANKSWSDVEFLEANGRRLNPATLEAVIYKK
ncbi:MAG: hypothetical protein HYV97_10285 [Bdellovibrio sp.]|nr:hypothetical protein [Bdellovibrio sp.]